jgi:hypothetical protein
MATDTSAERYADFDCNFREGGLDQFEPEPEAERGELWLRVAIPNAVEVREQPYVPTPKAPWWPFVVPVVVAATLAGVAWVGMRASERLVIPSPPIAAGDVPRLESEGVVAPDEGPDVVKAPPPEIPAAPSTPPPIASTVPAPVSTPLNPAFEATLAAVSASYRALDAASLRAVWPGADLGSLAEAFAGLKYQTLSFDRCETRPNGPSGAVASCAVSIASAPRSGVPALQRRHESWTLVLDRSGERWTITGVNVR